ncbi:hypothetical protein FQN53_003331 [Emmonsiellopsis sp. PD_33]|nr:hypothetical protein FQN53_003331 [Emmonsiellopsis sp. PD_33]
MAETTARRQRLRSALTHQPWGFSDKAKIAFAGDDSFHNATERWNTYNSPTFLASITVGTEEDVVKAVKLARSINIPFLATASRHGYGTTLGRLKDGLAIDLSTLNTVDVDKAAATVTVGPGTTNRDILGPVDAAGLEIQTGTSTEVSQIGAAIGAGVGRWSGVYGLLAEGLIAARIVTHDGQLVEASESENADLLWAIRGAGANFGIVVSATLKLSEPISGGQCLSVDAILTVDKKAEYFKLLEQFDGGQPSRLAISTVVIWEPNAGIPAILANWVWLGSEEDGRKVAAPLLALEPIISNSTMLKWTEVTEKAAFGANAKFADKKGNLISVYSTNVRNIVAATFESAVDKAVKLFSDYPDARDSALVFESFPPNESSGVPDNGMAYPWRDSNLLPFTWAEAGSPTEAAVNALGDELRRDFAVTGGYGDLAVYVNYAHGDESVEQVYGKDKLPRLVELKKEWDPDNVFCYCNPLPLELP